MGTLFGNRSKVTAVKDEEFSESSSMCDTIETANTLDHNNDVLYREIVHYHNEGDIYRILGLIEDIQTETILSTRMHLIIGMTLFKLGRIGGALREIALAIEMEIDTELRQSYTMTLVKLFEESGMKDQAVSCLGEILFMQEERSLIENVSPVNDEIQQELNSLMSNPLHKDPSIDVHINTPLHIQAQKYLEANQRLPPFSLSELCIKINSLVQQSINLLKLPYFDNCESDQLAPLFEAILYCGPVYLFKPIMDTESTLCKLMSFKMEQLPEIDFRISPRVVVKQLCEWSSQNSRLLWSTSRIIIQHQTISAFLNYYKHNYRVAIDEFVWVFYFLNGIRKRIPTLNETDLYFCTRTEFNTLLYASNCYTLIDIESSEQYIKNITHIHRKLVSEEYLWVLRKQYEIQAKFFLNCGLVYEKYASINGSYIVIDKDTFDSNGDTLNNSTRAYKYEKKSLFEAIRKYIIAATSSMRDDPSVILIYDRIIWAILLHGEIHLKCLWMFILLKNHFLIELDYGPLHISTEHDYRILKNNDIIGKYTNGWDLVYKIWDFYSELDPGLVKSCWKLENAEEFLIPQIYEQNSKLIILDKCFGSESTGSFIYDTKYSIKPKLKSCLKMFKSDKAFEESISISKELMFLWLDKYKENFGKCPSIVEDFVQELKR